ncbi:MAG: aldehyde ferredoxin oxidoreductase N-terminal domain-containing protein, partial [Haloarculaceae archaeon]
MVRDVPDRLLRVDLSVGTVESEPVPEAWRRKYVGGKGLGARYLYEELDPGTDPLAPENRLLFLLGPLSGALPGEGRYAAVTKS